ncbi:MAG TPA: type VII secretion target [Candidatus Limnocylindrales bacterium]
MNPIEVVTAELRRAAQDLGGMTEGTDGMIQGFISEVEGMGMPWGDDMIGMAIGMIYQTAMQLVMDGLRSNLDTIDGLAQRLGVAAEHYDMTDTDVAGKISSIYNPNTQI